MNPPRPSLVRLGAPRLTFRVRTLLVLLLVALPPLVAFGFFAVATSAESRAGSEAAAARDAAARAGGILGSAIHAAEEALGRVAADAAFADAAASGDAAAARARYAALVTTDRELAGWSVRVVGGATALDIVAPAPPPAGLGVSTVQALASGPLVHGGRLLLAVAAPLPALPDGAEGLRLVAWRDATGDVLEHMRIAAGGTIAIVGAGSERVAVGDGAAALNEPGSTAGAPLLLADGGVGRIAVSVPPAGEGFAAVGLAPALSVAGSLAVLWAVLLAVAFARSIGGELRRLADAAERVREGDYATAEAATAGDEMGRLAAVHRRLAASLAARDRQIAELAAQVAALPLGDDPRSVARGVAAAAAHVTGAGAWTMAVLRCSVPDLLPPGRYDARDGVAPQQEPAGAAPEWLRPAWLGLCDVTQPQDRSRLVETPEGAFVVALVAAGESLDAVLIAAWAGRPAPSAAERHLFALLARHAGTAIEHALLYAQLRAQTADLERLASVQVDFLRAVTHDLQTPLTSISLLSSELRARGGLDPTAAADLRAIEEQAERLRRMVAQLLVVSRLEAGAVKPRQEVLRAEGLVRRTWDALRPTDRSLDIRTDGADHLLVADADRLEQVMWALLENAVRYGTPGTTVQVRLGSRPRTPRDPELQPDATPTELVGEIAVSDRGIGMDPETQARAFEQFYRSDAARALVPDGSGIGLYAARGLVEAMGGTITAESEPGAGSTFRVSLPAEPGGDGGRPAERPPARVSAPGPRSTRHPPAPAGHRIRPRCPAAGSTRRTAR